MKIGFAWLILLGTGHLCLAASGPARILTLSESDIGSVSTAPGYSTILQFDSRPTSVVLGDQDAFKVEYVGNSLTIKPVMSHSRSNMFVFTDYDRFSFTLVAARGGAVDYVVQVKRKRTPSKTGTPGWSGGVVPENTDGGSGMTTIPLNRTATCGNRNVTVNSLSFPKDRPWLSVSFAISLTKPDAKHDAELKAEDVRVTRKGKPVPLETLYLERLSLPATGALVQGSVLLQTDAPRRTSDLSLELVAAPEKKCSTAKVSLRPRAGSEK